MKTNIIGRVVKSGFKTKAGAAKTMKKLKEENPNSRYVLCVPKTKGDIFIIEYENFFNN